MDIENNSLNTGTPEDPAPKPELTPTEKAKRKQWYVKQRKEEIELIELEVRYLKAQVDHYHLSQQINQIAKIERDKVATNPTNVENQNDPR